MFYAELIFTDHPEFLFEHENLGNLIAQVAEIAFEDSPADSMTNIVLFRRRGGRNSTEIVAVGTYLGTGNVFEVQETCMSNGKRPEPFTFHRKQVG